MRLLTFLGIGNYEEVLYRLGEQECRTKLCPVAISRIKGITDIVAFVTDEARCKWFNELVTEASAHGAASRAVGIDLPRDEAGMWELFRAVEAEMHDAPVVLDVTHAFRAIPLVAMAVAGFARATNPQVLNAVYYGAYEARNREGVAPIIDLTSLVSVLDWTSAVAAFRHYGDASSMAGLMERTCDRLGRDGFTAAASELRGVKSSLSAASEALRACRPRTAPSAAKDAQKQIEEHLPTIARHEPAFRAVSAELLEALGAIAAGAEAAANRAVLEAHLAMVRWYAEHRHPLHALALAREWIVTLACMLCGLDWTSREQRCEAEKRMQDHPVPEEVRVVWDRVSGWRNDVLHCGMRRGAMAAARVLTNVDRLTDELSPLLDLVTEDAHP